MADRYAVGTGNWNDTSTWSDISGGTTGLSVPVDGDDVYFDANSGTVTLNGAARCDTINFNGGGTLDTDSSNDYALTVDEQMYLLSAGTFNANGSTVKIGDGVTGSAYTLKVTNGTFNGGDGIHTIGCIQVNGGTCNLSSGTTTINGAETSSSAGCLQFTSGTLAHSTGTVIFDIQNYGNTIILLYNQDITLYNVYLDATTSAQKLQLWGADATGPRRKFTVANNLTIRGGRFLTKYSSVEEVDLDVTGNLSVIPSASTGTDIKAELSTYSSVINVGGKLTTQGTWYTGGVNYTPKAIVDLGTGAQEYGGIDLLTGTDATMSSGVTTIDGAGNAFRFDIQTGYNTYSNGSGTIKFTSSSDQTLYSTDSSADDFTQFHNLTLEKTSSTLQGMTTVGFHIKVGGNLTITSGELDTTTTSGVDHALTVTGDTIGAGTLTLNDSTYTGGGSGSHIEMPGGTITIGTSGVITNIDQLGSGIADSTITCTGSPTLGCRRFRCRPAGWTPATSTLKIEAGSSDINYSAYTLYNLEIDSSTNAPRMQGNITCTNNLTITAGELDTDDNDLTVTGITTIGGTLTLNSSTVSLGSAVTAGYAVTMAASGTFNGDSATITMGSIGPSSPISTVNFSSVTTTFTSRNTSASNNITQIGGNTTFSMSSGEMIMTTAAAGNLHFDPYGDKIFDLTINNGGNTVTLVDNLTVHRNLTITAGELDTGADKALTVDGDVTLDGTLVGNDSAIELGSLTINGTGIYTATTATTTITSRKSSSQYALDVNGTFTHNSGTVLLSDSSSNTSMGLGTSLWNLTLEGGSKKIRENTTINNILTITSGDLYSHNGTETLTVTGDVNVTGSIGVEIPFTDDMTFGSLQIGDGGTYEATSGITTLTNKRSETSVPYQLFVHSNGTFTHNSGTLKDTFDDTAHRWAIASGDSLYDVIIDNGSGITRLDTEDLDIAKDLDVVEGTIRQHATDGTGNITVDGDTTIEDGGTLGGNGDAGDYTFTKLIIESGGTYEATSGETGGLNHMTVSGTFAHNSGSVTIDEGDVDRLNGAGTLTFYKLTGATSGGGEQLRVEDITSLVVQHTLDVQTNFWLWGTGAPSLTIGTTSATGNLKLSSGELGVYGNAGAAVVVQGAAELYPVNITKTSGDWDFDDNDYDDSLWNLKWLNFNYDVVTPGTAGVKQSTLKLMGDCEFEAVTISTGDEIDMDGHRMECSGLLSTAGTASLNMGAGLLICERFYPNGEFYEEEGADIIVRGTVADATLVLDDYYFVGDANTNILINNGSIRTYWAGSRRYVGNIIIGSGIFESKDGDNENSCNNLTIAAGATLDGDDDTITVAGDFTTAGGLLGASCFYGDNNHYIESDSAVNYSGNAATYECWFNSDATSGYILKHWGSTYGFYLRIDGANLQLAFKDAQFSFSNETGYRDQRWHHCAIVIEDTVCKWYLDGKLVQEDTGLSWASPNTEFVVGGDTYSFDGHIDEVRVWEDVRTPTEIRTNILTESPAGDYLLVHYKMNEGTGSVVDDATENYDAKMYNRTTTLAEGSWAGAGTFTYDTSTLKFTGTSTFTYNSDELIGSLIVNAPLTLKGISSDNDQLRIHGDTFTMNSSGTITSTSEESIKLKNDLAGGTLTFDAPTTNLANLYKLNANHTAGTMSIPELTTPRLYCTTTATETRAIGNLTITQILFVDGANTFNANGNTITSKLVDTDGTATLNLQNSTLILSDTSGLTSESGVTLVGGPSATISGSSAATTFESQNNWKVVGKCENLDVTNEELRVTGQVINCTGYIIQQHPSIDANQQLDYDTADDRDIQFGVPDLDKNTELVT